MLCFNGTLLPDATLTNSRKAHVNEFFKNTICIHRTLMQFKKIQLFFYKAEQWKMNEIKQFYLPPKRLQDCQHPSGLSTCRYGSNTHDTGDMLTATLFWISCIFETIRPFERTRVYIPMGGSKRGGRGSGPPEKSLNIGFLNNTGQIIKLPSHHSMLGHHRHASETPLNGWWADYGPLLMVFSTLPSSTKNKPKQKTLSLSEFHCDYKPCH